MHPAPSAAPLLGQPVHARCGDGLGVAQEGEVVSIDNDHSADQGCERLNQRQRNSLIFPAVDHAYAVAKLSK